MDELSLLWPNLQFRERLQIGSGIQCKRWQFPLRSLCINMAWVFCPCWPHPISFLFLEKRSAGHRSAGMSMVKKETCRFWRHRSKGRNWQRFWFTRNWSRYLRRKWWHKNGFHWSRRREERKRMSGIRPFIHKLGRCQWRHCWIHALSPWIFCSIQRSTHEMQVSAMQVKYVRCCLRNPRVASFDYPEGVGPEDSIIDYNWFKIAFDKQKDIFKHKWIV